jgi:hypothetical protein
MNIMKCKFSKIETDHKDELLACRFFVVGVSDTDISIGRLGVVESFFELRKTTCPSLGEFQLVRLVGLIVQ